MKLTKQALINSLPVDLVNNNLTLQMGVPGRGLFEVKTDTAPLVRDLFQFSGQLSGNPLCSILFGYVESVVEKQIGLYQVFVREFAAAMNRRVYLNLRHPTPDQVLEELSRQTGNQFVLPDSPWVQKTSPRFMHAGGGYMLLDKLLEAWQVQNPVWFQQSDGRVYVGELENSLPGQRLVSVPSKLFSSVTVTGGTVSLIVPRLRPGVQIQIGQEIKFIESVEVFQIQVGGALEDRMRIKWRDNLFKQTMKAIA